MRKVFDPKSMPKSSPSIRPAFFNAKEQREAREKLMAEKARERLEAEARRRGKTVEELEELRRLDLERRARFEKEAAEAARRKATAKAERKQFQQDQAALKKRRIEEWKKAKRLEAQLAEKEHYDLECLKRRLARED